ncbi:Outer membrane porin protein 32 precursor [compost metagenome]
MKKSLFAFSLLTSMAGISYAQSSVTVYGVVDLGLKIENDGGGRTVGIASGNQSVSRVGFKGTEDLGNGLKVNFVLEAGINADNGSLSDATRFFNRQSYVSLAGGFGEVKLGRVQTVVFTNSAVFDPFADTLAGDSVRIFNYGGNRIDNTVNYSFAAQNGINGQAAYSFGEVAGSMSSGRTVAGALGYAKGPLAAVLTYQNTNNATATDSTKTTLLGGNYNFGLLQPFLAYAINKGPSTLDTRDSLIGLKINLTPADTIMTSFMYKQDKVNNNANTRQIAVGYTHNLSVRTNLYTSWALLSNDDNANVRVVAAGKNDNLFNVGIRHKF